MSNTSDEQLNKFIEDYNKLFNVPANKANESICQRYRVEHPNEFKTSDWSIDKHRKRFMDWMSKQSAETIK